MIEVEVKGKVTSEKQLEIIDGLVPEWQFLGEETQDDTYYAHPVRNFTDTDEALRIRRIGDDFYLTYKGPKMDTISKTREEIEVVTSPELGKILERMGFSPVARIIKTRRNYGKDNIVLSIDEVEDLGTFVELEAASDDPEDAKELLSLLEMLNLQSETRSYLELFLEDRH
jgi:adenylate cyclase class 2